MRSFLFQLIHIPAGYMYMRLRYGKYHKRKLIEVFDGKYYNAGMVAIWMPILFGVIVIMTLALIYVGVILMS